MTDNKNGLNLLTSEDKKPYAYVTKVHQVKSGSKWVKESTETAWLCETIYNHIIDSSPFFRRLGGSETATREYTCRGYKVTRLFSTSPDKLTRSVYTFSFDYRVFDLPKL